MRGLCNKCPHGKTRETCKRLCKEALAYANQDLKPQHRSDKETPTGLITSGGKWKYVDPSRYTSDERKRLIYELYLDGKTQQDIAIHVEVSQPYVHEVIRKMKKKIERIIGTPKNK